MIQMVRDKDRVKVRDKDRVKVRDKDRVKGRDPVVVLGDRRELQKVLEELL
jgi:hypothetical protein